MAASELKELITSSTETNRIFNELPKATIVLVSRPDAGDIPLLLSYTIDFQYRQFKWQLVKKASHVLCLHFKLKTHGFIKKIHQKPEQVKKWLHNLGIAVVHDDDNEGSVQTRDVPSSAALPMLRPTLERRQSIADRAKTAMQEYLDHFLGNLDIVNSREVCEFMEVSMLSFCPKYGSKLKEEYVLVKHLAGRKCSACLWNCFNDEWQKVWAVLKPGFIALLKDPFDAEPLDAIIFDVLFPSDGNGEGQISWTKETNRHNPLRHSFLVSCESRNVTIRTSSKAKVRDWVAATKDAGLRPPDGWCHPHRFGSFAPPRGVTDNGSRAQWLVGGLTAFEAIALAIAGAKSEIYMCGWWPCPQLHLQRHLQSHESSHLDSLLEAKAKQGVQIYILMYEELYLALKINSVYSTKKLPAHENVQVLCYPDLFSSGVSSKFYHEKFVIVDNDVCFIGGLGGYFDLFDSYEHQVGGPASDCISPRDSETMNDVPDSGISPLKGWHGIHCALWGPPCCDVARHFVQRWNFAKRNKAPNERGIHLLMPQQCLMIPHYMGKNKELEVENSTVADTSKVMSRDGSSSAVAELEDMKFWLRRWSSVSSEDIPLLDADGVDASNGQPSRPSIVHERHSLNLQQELFSDVVHSGIKPSDREWWENGQAGPRVACRCQAVKSVRQWPFRTSQVEESIHKAYCSLTEKAEHFIYIENQCFISGLSGEDIIRNPMFDSLYKRIVKAYNEKQYFRAIIVIPLLPGVQRVLYDVKDIEHQQYGTLSRINSSILVTLFQILGPRLYDYISFYGLSGYGRLSNDGPVASSPVMIVDDNTVLVGSASINDWRSLRMKLAESSFIHDRRYLRMGGSEIGVLIEDKEVVESSMGGNPWKAGKFALSLRLSLWSEYLGLQSTEINKIADPVIDSTYKGIWMATAMRNLIYEGESSCIDWVYRSSLRQRLSERIGKQRHTIAPEKLEELEACQVKGHLVYFPAEFMLHADSRPMFEEIMGHASTTRAG